MKKQLSILFAAVLLFSSLFSFPASALETEIRLSTSQTAQILAHVEEHIKKTNGEYYTFQEFSGDVHLTELDGNRFTVDIAAKMFMTLKARTPEELPTVKAILDTCSLSSKSFSGKSALSTEKTAQLLNTKNLNIPQAEVYQAATQITETVKLAYDNIGVSNEFNFTLKAMGTILGDSATVDRLLVLDGLTEYRDAQIMQRDSFDTMYQTEKSDFWPEIREKAKTTSQLIAPRAIYSPYNRVAARDYALEYSSNPYSWRPCSTCGSTSCDAKTNHLFYNLKQYGEYGHNDCMNFVSQALRAGGMRTNSTWYVGSAAWTGCISFYRTQIGNTIYWHNYTNANAGCIKLLKNPKHTSSNPDYDHAELIVLNDTVNRSASAHSRDKHKEPYYSAGNYDYFGVYTS